jgi:hypothetical protein
MSSKHKKKPTPKPTAEEIKKAQEKAAKKAAKAAEKAAKAAKKAAEKKKKQEEREAQIKTDQENIDELVKTMNDDQKAALFDELSHSCKSTTEVDGKIVIACPLAARMVYSASPEGTPDALSPDVWNAVKDANPTSCIDTDFIAQEEGNSYRSPYVPWGPISGRGADGKPVLTKGNNSGVTIGAGVDLGQIDQAEFDELTDGVSQETKDRLQPFVGKTQEEACTALREAKKDGPVVLNADDVNIINRHEMMKMVRELKASFEHLRKVYAAALNNKIRKERKRKKPNETKIQEWTDKINSAKGFDKLSCADQTALFSTMYNEGTITRKHTKPYINALIEGDGNGARAALAAKTKDKNPVIAARGKEELQYVKDHPPPPPPSAQPSTTGGSATDHPAGP